MSHELRTPLNAIIGFSEIIARQLFGRIGSPRYVEYGEDIRESAAHLLALINQILEMSRIEASKRQLALSRIYVADAVQFAFRFLRGDAEASRISLDYAPAEAAMELCADELAARQILINLVSNAVKFTPPGGTVRVTSRRDGDAAIVIEVTYTGIGIEVEKLHRLGRPFERAAAGDDLLIAGQPGTGLGLALSKE